MSASLVGSEMCIRDRPNGPSRAGPRGQRGSPGARALDAGAPRRVRNGPRSPKRPPFMRPIVLFACWGPELWARRTSAPGRREPNARVDASIAAPPARAWRTPAPGDEGLARCAGCLPPGGLRASAAASPARALGVALPSGPA
eukprot:10324608-Alexandrium_andersonii.AAC.1